MLMEQESLPKEAMSALDTGSEWEYPLWQSANRANSILYACDRNSTSGKLADSAAAVATMLPVMRSMFFGYMER